MSEFREATTDFDPIVEFSELKRSILASFSRSSSEAICRVLVKELAEAVFNGEDAVEIRRDNSSLSSNERVCEKLTTQQEVEWVMQVLDHALTLPVSSPGTHEIVSSAVRLYLAWAGAVALNHQNLPSSAVCPPPIRNDPGLYFRRIVDSLRHVFVPQPLSESIQQLYNEQGVGMLQRQATEIRTVLSAMEKLLGTRGKRGAIDGCGEVSDELREEVWSRCLLFLLNAGDLLMGGGTRSGSPKDSLSRAVSRDFASSLFACWFQAGLLDLVPSPEYWRSLSAMCWRWAPQAAIVECWARWMVAIAVQLVAAVQQLQPYTEETHSTLLGVGRMEALQGNSDGEDPLPSACLQNAKKEALVEVWSRAFPLLGDPARLFEHAVASISDTCAEADDLPSSASSASALCLFLQVTAFSRIIDIFLGKEERRSEDESSIRHAVHHLPSYCEELERHWHNYYLHLDKQQQQTRRKLQRMGQLPLLGNGEQQNDYTTAGAAYPHPPLTPNPYMLNKKKEKELQQQSRRHSHAVLMGDAARRPPLQHQQRFSKQVFFEQKMEAEGITSISEEEGVEETEQSQPEPDQDALFKLRLSATHRQLATGHYVWYILRSNEFHRSPRGLQLPSGGVVMSGVERASQVESGTLLEVFMELLFRTALLQRMDEGGGGKRSDGSAALANYAADNEDARSEKSAASGSTAVGGLREQARQFSSSSSLGNVDAAASGGMPRRPPQPSTVVKGGRAEENRKSFAAQSTQSYAGGEHHHRGSTPAAGPLPIKLGNVPNHLPTQPTATSISRPARPPPLTGLGQQQGGSIPAEGIGGCQPPSVLPASLQQFSSPAEMPIVDGATASRASAVGDLCKIVCAKSSREKLPNERLAYFYLIVHKALIDKDRLVLCSILCHSVDLFKLGLPGVEMLLPSYLEVVNIVLAESLERRLHPSIDEVGMRHACLLCLASIVSWPSTFGATTIVGGDYPSLRQSATSKQGHDTQTPQGGRDNIAVAEGAVTERFIILRKKILHTLVVALRGETDSSNIQLTAALCSLFCWEQCRYDLTSKKDGGEVGSTTLVNGAGKRFSVSALRELSSAICDCLCKPQWQNDLAACLAAFDCLNCIAALPAAVLFPTASAGAEDGHGDSGVDLSLGNLVVSSLCHFIDSQLQRPPMQHSRDLHSSVVAAYGSLATWLQAAPTLKEIDSYLAQVAQAIELGMTGATQGAAQTAMGGPKPASQRVFEAAEHLLHAIFATNSERKQNQQIRPIQDEHWLAEKYSNYGVKLSNFHYYLIGQETVLSLHEAKHILHLSKGLPSVLAVLRTPFRPAHTFLIQLKPRSNTGPLTDKSLQAVKDGPSEPENQAPQRGTPFGGAGGEQQESDRVHASPPNGDVKREGVEKSEAPSRPLSERNSIIGRSLDSLGGSEPIKQFEFPAEAVNPQCKLDSEFKPLEPNEEVSAIQAQLTQIQTRLANGAGSGVSEERDVRNVWLKPPLGAALTRPPMPESPASSCDSARVFLYDMGFVNSRAFGTTFIPLASTPKSGEGSFTAAADSKSTTTSQSPTANSHFYPYPSSFYSAMSEEVDYVPTKLTTTVHIFYVRDGQRMAAAILYNNLNLASDGGMSSTFRSLLADLGTGVSASKGKSERQWQQCWTGHWANKREAKSKKGDEGVGSDEQRSKDAESKGKYVLDGIEHCLWWANEQVEVAFLLPTERCLQRHQRFIEDCQAENLLATNHVVTSESSASTASIANNDNHPTCTVRGSLIPVELGTTNNTTPLFPMVTSRHRGGCKREKMELEDGAKPLEATDPTMASLNGELSANRRPLTLLLGMDELNVLEREMRRRASTTAAVDKLQQMWGSNREKAKEASEQQPKEEPSSPTFPNLRRMSKDLVQLPDRHPLLALATVGATRGGNEEEKDTRMPAGTVGWNASMEDERDDGPKERRITIFTAVGSLSSEQVARPFEHGAEPVLHRQLGTTGSLEARPSSPIMSLTTATTVVVKSARFSPRRRQHFIPTDLASSPLTSRNGSTDGTEGLLSPQLKKTISAGGASSETLNIAEQQAGGREGNTSRSTWHQPLPMLTAMSERAEMNRDAGGVGRISATAGTSLSTPLHGPVRKSSTPTFYTASTSPSMGQLSPRYSNEVGTKQRKSSASSLLAAAPPLMNKALAWKSRRSSSVAALISPLFPTPPTAQLSKRTADSESTSPGWNNHMGAGGGGGVRAKRKFSYNNSHPSLFLHPQPPQPQQVEKTTPTRSTTNHEAIREEVVTPLQQSARNASASSFFNFAPSASSSTTPLTPAAPSSAPPTAGTSTISSISSIAYLKWVFGKGRGGAASQKQGGSSAEGPKSTVATSRSAGGAGQAGFGNHSQPRLHSLDGSEASHLEGGGEGSGSLRNNVASSSTTTWRQWWGTGGQSLTSMASADVSVKCASAEQQQNHASQTVECTSGVGATNGGLHHHKPQIRADAQVTTTQPGHESDSKVTHNNPAIGRSAAEGQGGSSRPRIGAASIGGTQHRIFVVWLERLEDMFSFPHDQLLAYTEDGSNYAPHAAQSAAAHSHQQGQSLPAPSSSSPPPPTFIIYLHSFEPGLVRVHVDPLWGAGGGRSGLPSPLHDGMCVSIKSLATMLQHTVASVARRRLIDQAAVAGATDGVHQPHVKRRHAISEFGRKFRGGSPQTGGESYAEFLKSFISLKRMSIADIAGEPVAMKTV